MHGKRPARQPEWGFRVLEPQEPSNKHNELDHIPSVPFEIFSEAVDEVERNVKSPRELAVSSALAVISLACQGLYDIRSPFGSLCPLSLAIMAIADSGDGKSPSLRALFSSASKYQEKLLIEREIDLIKYNSNHGIWIEILKELKSNLRRCVRQGKCIEEVSRKIHEHQEKEPSPPLKLSFLNDDVTTPALTRPMNKGLSSAGLISSEASGILNGGALQQFEIINSVWSGDGVRVGRVSSESYQVLDARLAICLMIQPSALNSFIKNKGEVARGSGLLSRFLFCKPKSTKGSRIEDGSEKQWNACDRFGNRSVALLEKYVERCRIGGNVREEIRLSDRASKLWIATRNEIEKEMSEEGAYGWAPDYASKLPENMLRLAGVFHVFEGREGDVSETTMHAAIDLGYWFSRQFNKVFSPDTLLENEASELHCWLRAQYDKTNDRRCDKAYIRNYCPNGLRDTERLKQLYDKLARDGLIRVVTEGRKEVVVLM